jgi:hypothetical protein
MFQKKKILMLLKVNNTRVESVMGKPRQNCDSNYLYSIRLSYLCKLPDIASEIKVGRLEWLEHVIKMEDTRLPTMLFNAKPEGRRRVGRPRLRWLDDDEVDIKALGIKIGRMKVQDRKEWSAIVREAKAELKGP